jgi:hypothetical protein
VILASDAHRMSRGPALTLGRGAALAAGLDLARISYMIEQLPRQVLLRGLPAPSRPTKVGLFNRCTPNRGAAG